MHTIPGLRIILNTLNDRSIKAKMVLDTLASKRLWLDREKTICTVSNGIWCGGYTASTEYDDQAEFTQALADDLDESYIRDIKDGLNCYVFTPFQVGGIPAYVQELGLGYLTALANESLSAIRSAEPIVLGTDDPLHLSNQERGWFAEILTTRCLTLINTFRTASTSLQYIHTARGGLLGSCTPKNVVAEDELIDALIAEFGELIRLPGLPEPAKYFGTCADVINKVTQLPDDFGERYSTSDSIFQRSNAKE